MQFVRTSVVIENTDDFNCDNILIGNDGNNNHEKFTLLEFKNNEICKYVGTKMQINQKIIRQFINLDFINLCDPVHQ